MLTCYWFAFCAFFQKDYLYHDNMIRLVELMATSFRNLFWKVKKEDKDIFFDFYHYAISTVIISGFQKHFPGSRQKFTRNFKMRLYELISELLTGIRLRRSHLQKGILKYFPKTHSELDNITDKSKEKSQEGLDSNSISIRNEELDADELSPRTTASSLSEEYEKSTEEVKRILNQSKSLQFPNSVTEEKHSIPQQNFLHLQKEESPIQEVYKKLLFDLYEEYWSPRCNSFSIRYPIQKKKEDNCNRSKSSLSYMEETKITKSCQRRFDELDVDKMYPKQDRKLTSQPAPSKLDVEMKTAEKYWNSYSVSPLLNRFLKPPIEIAKRKNHRLLPKIGVKSIFFFGCKEWIEEPNNKEKVKSIEMFHKSMIRQKTILEDDVKNREDTKKVIKSIRQITSNEIRNIDKISRQHLCDKNHLLNDLYDRIQEEREQNRKKKVRAGFSLGVVRKESYEYHWKEEVSLRNVNLKMRKVR